MIALIKILATGFMWLMIIIFSTMLGAIVIQTTWLTVLIFTVLFSYIIGSLVGVRKTK